jgi:hypothetical protein
VTWQAAIETLISEIVLRGGGGRLVIPRADLTRFAHMENPAPRPCYRSFG